MNRILKRLLIGPSVLALIPVCMSTLGCGGDKTIEDRKANYNQEMEDTFRSSSTAQQTREELAEDEAMAAGTQEPGAAPEEGAEEQK